MAAIQDYIREIQSNLAAGNATEHTHRPALKTFIESVQSGVVAVNEPKRIDCGAPDFIITKGHTPVGYVEAKDIGASLDEAESSEQLRRYRESLGNLILTDYIEFRWYVGDECRLTARLGSIDTNNRIREDAQGCEQVLELLRAFVETQAPTVARPKELAQRMAHIARLIRDAIAKALSQESDTGSLHSQWNGFRETLLHDLTEAEFADMYAQTICYGLFAARCNTSECSGFTREHAAYDLPKTNPFLRKMFQHIAGYDLDDRIAWAVDDVANLLAHADMESILRDFGSRTRREDPVVHFYETFLAAYDPKMREARGVYYTPEPVVSYIVRSVDHILKNDFGLAEGLAHRGTVKVNTGDTESEVHKVQILDPATGTGTFLHGVIDQIHESFSGNAGMWSAYVREHLLPRVHGFELLMAPYAVTHMKLGLQLQETGYDFGTDERLRVYLTNTLEEAEQYVGHNLFSQFIVEEANSASRIKKDVPVMVVLGNPPYSVSSQNKGEWISQLIRDYKTGLKEKKLNLDDDFIKFFRFAQHRIEQTGYGILALITNNVYLDGITHRQMRKSLMNTFDDIYIMNLHGNTNKKERCPDGSKDENVFDIQIGVSIGIFVRKPKPRSTCQVHFTEIWGNRDRKYDILSSEDVSTTKWTLLEDVGRMSCLGEFAFFAPKAFDNVSEYCHYCSTRSIYMIGQNGIKTDRDTLFLDFDYATLHNRIATFYSEAGLSTPFQTDYQVQDSSSYDLLSRRLKTTFSPDCIHRSLYRPFDQRYLYYSPGLTSRPARDVMRHMLSLPNYALITTRQTQDAWDAFVTNAICCHKSCAAYDINSVFPLYLYPSDATRTTLFDEDERTDAPGGRRPNLAPEFIADFSGRLGLQFIQDGRGDLTTTFGPEDIFNYMYAVFHSPTYRSRYAEFLKIDFPRLPLTSKPELFRELCALGDNLTGLHLMEKTGSDPAAFNINGSNVVEDIRYCEPDNNGNTGRVWINRTQYFENVPPEVWNFHIGGYQVCQKWLKDRKGRTLSFDDLDHYRRVVAALGDTICLMNEIDNIIAHHGGFPML